MLRHILFNICIGVSYCAHAQDHNDSINITRHMDEIVVTGIRDESKTESSLNISGLNKSKIENSISYNLSDALTRIPGINQINTGNAISKPVIRGLYGNRILVLFSGLRFDNQQFQDEHGLGLSQIGIERAEVIKGPASILYGTDAIGGVINIIEETPINIGNSLNLNIRGYSNTRGTLSDIGYSHSNVKTWFRIRGGIESNGDYADGNNFRVLNSRNTGKYLKAGFGIMRKRWQQNNAYNYLYNQYGFILDSLTKLYVNDNRWSRSMLGPHHNVELHTFSSQNTVRLKSSILKINAGFQSNQRAEDEGSGQISLNMHLLSLLENIKWEKKLSSHLLLITNQQFTYENNRNLGKRVLIPDAHLIEFNISAFLKYSHNHLTIEGGLGNNQKEIQTIKTRSLNSGDNNTPDTTILPFTKNRLATNAMLGLNYTMQNITIKTCVASGNRAANLAELSSNGLHEGTYHVEIGNPDLQMEQNVNAEVGFDIHTTKLLVSTSSYFNRILNYIYLTKSKEPAWYGFDRYKYLQQNASIYGGELTVHYHVIKKVEIGTSFSMTNAKLDDGNHLPFIPPYKLVSSVKYETILHGLIHHLEIEPEIVYSFAQDKPASYETATPKYMLYNLNIGFITTFRHHTLSWHLSCRNMTNKTYSDHLSRLKYYGFYNQGVNLVLSMNSTLNWQ